MTRAAQQESIEGAVQDAILYRLRFGRDVSRWASSGLRIASCNWKQDGVWGRQVTSLAAILTHKWSVRWGNFEYTFPGCRDHKNAQQALHIFVSGELRIGILT